MIYKGVNEIFYSGRKCSTAAMKKKNNLVRGFHKFRGGGRERKKKVNLRVGSITVMLQGVGRGWPWHKVAAPGA